MSSALDNPLFSQIRTIIHEARGRAVSVVNQAIVELYWEIGRLIVEHEQEGLARAAYGERVLADLAERLTAEFGKGFDERNLRNMRQVFQAFPIRNALRSELSWTHYRLLLRASTAAARSWYLNEAADAGALPADVPGDQRRRGRHRDRHGARLLRPALTGNRARRGWAAAADLDTMPRVRQD